MKALGFAGGLLLIMDQSECPIWFVTHIGDSPAVSFLEAYVCRVW